MKLFIFVYFQVFSCLVYAQITNAVDAEKQLEIICRKISILLLVEDDINTDIIYYHIGKILAKEIIFQKTKDDFLYKFVPCPRTQPQHNFGPGWQDPDGVIWSDNQLHKLSWDDAMVLAKKKGARLPSLKEFRKFIDFFGTTNQETKSGSITYYPVAQFMSFLQRYNNGLCASFWLCDQNKDNDRYALYYNYWYESNQCMQTSKDQELNVCFVRGGSARALADNIDK